MLGNFQYAEHWPVVGDYDFQSYFFIQVLNVLMITYFNLAFLDISCKEEKISFSFLS